MMLCQFLMHYIFVLHGTFLYSICSICWLIVNNFPIRFSIIVGPLCILCAPYTGGKGLKQQQGLLSSPDNFLSWFFYPYDVQGKVWQIHYTLHVSGNNRLFLTASVESDQTAHKGKLILVALLDIFNNNLVNKFLKMQYYDLLSPFPYVKF